MSITPTTVSNIHLYIYKPPPLPPKKNNNNKIKRGIATDNCSK